MIYSEAEERARQFAIERHGDQMYGKHPYVFHLTAVWQVLRDFSYPRSSGLTIAAFLHDTIEDTATNKHEIESRFGEYVSDLVWAVTGRGATRKERIKDAYRKIQAFPAAACLKLADRIANVESCRSEAVHNINLTTPLLEMYRNEHKGFSEALKGLGTPVMWERLDMALTQNAFLTEKDLTDVMRGYADQLRGMKK